MPSCRIESTKQEHMGLLKLGYLMNLTIYMILVYIDSKLGSFLQSMSAMVTIDTLCITRNLEDV